MNALTQLRDLLAEHDWNKEFANLIAADLGLNRAKIDFDGPAIATWQSLLDHAHHHGKIPSLVKRAADYFPAFRHTLNAAFANYQQQNVPSPPTDTATMLANYRHWVHQQYGTMQVFGMSQPVPLGDIYTDVYVLDQLTALRRFNLDELQERFRYNQRDQGLWAERQAGLSLVQPNSRLYILGKPGAGKTTFLRHVAVQVAKEVLLPGKLPIFISLKALADSGQPLLLFAAQQLVDGGVVGEKAWLTRWLHDGTALLLLDGLDEADNRRGVIIEEIKQITRRYGNCSILLTCRIAAAEYTFERFHYLEMADFAPEQVETFVRSWFRDAGAGQAVTDPKIAEAMLKELRKKEHEGIRELASSPLLLTLLCLAYKETHHFPAQRVEIYEEALEALLKKWDITRNIRRNSTYGQLSLGRKRQMLARIAYETFCEKQVFLPQQILVAKLKAYLIHVPEMPEAIDIEADKVLRDIVTHHGIFIEQSHQIFSFSHLTFQEYFAAKCIVEHVSDNTLIKLVNNIAGHRWREIFLLVASLLSSGEKFFELFHLALTDIASTEIRVMALFHQANGATMYESLNSYQHVAVRAWYLSLDIAHALTRTIAASRSTEFVYTIRRAKASVLDQSRAYSRNLALRLGIDPQRILSRALTLDLKFAEAMGSNKNFDFILTRINDLNRKLDFEHNVYKGVDLTIDSVLVIFYTVTRTIISHPKENRQHIAQALPLLQLSLEKLSFIAMHWQMSALADALTQQTWPDSNASNRTWQRFITSLERILTQQRGFKLDWELSEKQWKQVYDYLRSSHLLLDCLNLAYVQDRAAIEDQLLLPPPP